MLADKRDHLRRIFCRNSNNRSACIRQHAQEQPGSTRAQIFEERDGLFVHKSLLALLRFGAIYSASLLSGLSAAHLEKIRPVRYQRAGLFISNVSASLGIPRLDQPHSKAQAAD